MNFESDLESTEAYPKVVNHVMFFFLWDDFYFQVRRETFQLPDQGKFSATRPVSHVSLLIAELRSLLHEPTCRGYVPLFPIKVRMFGDTMLRVSWPVWVGSQAGLHRVCSAFPIVWFICYSFVSTMFLPIYPLNSFETIIIFQHLVQLQWFIDLIERFQFFI